MGIVSDFLEREVSGGLTLVEKRSQGRGLLPGWKGDGHALRIEGEPRRCDAFAAQADRGWGVFRIGVNLTVAGIARAVDGFEAVQETGGFTGFQGLCTNRGCEHRVARVDLSDRDRCICLLYTSPSPRDA